MSYRDYLKEARKKEAERNERLAKKGLVYPEFGTPEYKQYWDNKFAEAEMWEHDQIKLKKEFGTPFSVVADKVKNAFVMADVNPDYCDVCPYFFDGEYLYSCSDEKYNVDNAIFFGVIHYDALGHLRVFNTDELCSKHFKDYQVCNDLSVQSLTKHTLALGRAERESLSAAWRNVDRSEYIEKQIHFLKKSMNPFL